MNEVNFNNDKYRDLALKLQHIDNSTHSPVDAFFLLINGVNKDNLSNLCEMTQQTYSLPPISIQLSDDECYKLTQNLNASYIDKTTILNLAHQCLKKGLHLGNKTINDGKINTSSWISHSIYASEVCYCLARNLELNPDEAKTLGLMHDYGRKFNHTFEHTVDGFKFLADLGWYNEAIGCLTHSFVNGGRCSNNEQAVDGFYVDDNGDPKWKENTKKDDITMFLENYKYTDYDVLLNIADLMATDKGIVAPHERIADIATRRVIDPTNRAYFLADVTNILIDFLKKTNFVNDNIKYIKATKNTSLEETEKYFNEISEYFFKVYTQMSKQNINSYTI